MRSADGHRAVALNWCAIMAAMGHFEGRRRAGWRRPAPLIWAALLGMPLAGCGDQEDASLCTAFAEFLAARATVQALDPQTLGAEQATDITENYLASVNRLQQTVDDRYEQQVFDLENAVNDVLLTLTSVQDDADFATWGPLVEDDLETAADAAAQVEDSIEPSCNPDTSD